MEIRWVTFNLKCQNEEIPMQYTMHENKIYYNITNIRRNYNIRPKVLRNMANNLSFDICNSESRGFYQAVYLQQNLPKRKITLCNNEETFYQILKECKVEFLFEQSEQTNELENTEFESFNESYESRRSSEVGILNSSYLSTERSGEGIEDGLEGSTVMLNQGNTKEGELSNLRLELMKDRIEKNKNSPKQNKMIHKLLKTMIDFQETKSKTQTKKKFSQLFKVIKQTIDLIPNVTSRRYTSITQDEERIRKNWNLYKNLGTLSSQIHDDLNTQEKGKALTDIKDIKKGMEKKSEFSYEKLDNICRKFYKDTLHDTLKEYYATKNGFILFSEITKNIHEKR